MYFAVFIFGALIVVLFVAAMLLLDVSISTQSMLRVLEHLLPGTDQRFPLLFVSYGFMRRIVRDAQANEYRAKYVRNDQSIRQVLPNRTRGHMQHRCLDQHAPPSLCIP